MSTRRSALLVGIVMLGVMAAGVAVLGQDEGRVAASPAPGGVVEVAATGRWSQLPAAPIAFRTAPATGWTGREFLIWGGSAGVEADVLRSDGAGYNPRTGQWRLLPAAPIPARTQAASAWTGHELFVWGGFDTPDPPHVIGDGAAYDPALNRWRPLPAAPLAARAGAAAVWTGREVIVVGGRSAASTAANEFADAAAYDPVHNSWRLFPRLQIPEDQQLWDPVAVWAGNQLLVWWPWSHTQVVPNGISGTYGYHLFRYNPSGDRWDLLPAAPNTPAGIGRPAWTGHDVIVGGAQPFRGGFGGPAGWVPPHRYDPGTNTWTEIRNAPEGVGTTVWTGDGLLLAKDRELSMWVADTGTWRRLPADPGTTASVPALPAAAWTGRELLLWGTDSAPTPQVVGLRFGP